MRAARARAHTNIALVKYWGKREGAPDQNLPAVGSLSLTLAELYTVTTVAPGAADQFELDGAPQAGERSAKVFRHLDRVWKTRGRTTVRPPCRVSSTNHVPTAAGLASSASGFAALTLAASAAFGVDGDRSVLSTLARRGSGSAARSLWGGFVRLERGSRADGSDCVARPLFAASHWDLRLVVARAAQGAKAVGSTAGMNRCRDTSPYYRAWVETAEADLALAERALAARDFSRLGEVMEHSCFKMHACMLASVPPLVYWNPTTLALVQAVSQARARGLLGYITSDAGPHIKILCRTADAPALRQVALSVPGTVDATIYRPGPDAVLETP
ncbi:MAG: diphosphomevalonate decarboxylase [Nannocystaceae bacterium]